MSLTLFTGGCLSSSLSCLVGVVEYSVIMAAPLAARGARFVQRHMSTQLIRTAECDELTATFAMAR